MAKSRIKKRQFEVSTRIYQSHVVGSNKINSNSHMKRFSGAPLALEIVYSFTLNCIRTTQKTYECSCAYEKNALESRGKIFKKEDTRTPGHGFTASDGTPGHGFTASDGQIKGVLHSAHAKGSEKILKIKPKTLIQNSCS